MIVLALILFCMGLETNDPLSQFLWEKRIIVVVSDSNTNELMKKQIELFDQFPEEFEDRDMVLIEVYNDHSQIQSKRSTSAEHLSLINKFSTRSRFSLYLIGKDGGPKLKSKEVVNPLEIFQLIDSMPMRQREMRSREG